MLLFTVVGYLTAWSRGKRREGWGWGRRGRLSRWQQIWGRKWLGGGRSAAGWRMLNGLDGVPALDGGKTLRTVKITLVLYDQRRAGDGASQRESRQVCGPPRGRKESTRERCQTKTDPMLNTIGGTPPPVTHQCQETPLSRSGRGWHTRSHTWGQRQTGSIWCASTRSYAGQATATGVHRWRGGSLYAQPPVKRMHRKNWYKGFTIKVSAVTQQWHTSCPF